MLFCNKEISGPFTIPSGIVTAEVSVLERIANEIPEIGILTTKSIGIKSMPGNREPIIAQYDSFSFINAVGLTNKGATYFAKELRKIKIPDNKFLLCSIFGSNEEEFHKIAEKLFEVCDGFELNLSCPHSEKYGQIVGQDKKLIYKITKSVSSLGKPVFVKISPNLDIKEMVKSGIEGGASGITAINTVGPGMHFHDGYPVLSNKTGGISGRAILPIGLRCIKEIRNITNLPIIACGGISTAEDIKNYKKAGANFFGIGSALAGMNTEEIKYYFHTLLEDLKKGTNNAIKLLKKADMNYKKCEIKENKKLAKDLFLLKLDNELKIEPGQFIFVWLPEKGEKPFSVFDNNPLTLLIQKKGYFTTELMKLKKGTNLYIRGPYGKTPEVKGKVLLVGGGTGIAPLLLFAKKNRETISLLGAKDKSHLPCIEKFKFFCREVYLTTETGEIGHKGFLTDILEKIIKKTAPDYCINCGPKIMIKKSVEIEKRYLDGINIYSSVDFMTRCGIGLCGSCASPSGYRSCVDGPFLKSEINL